jgi:hypothetical protein
MVNRIKRDNARQLLEKFLQGEITNDTFVNEYPPGEDDDRAIASVYEQLWGFWDDRETHALTDKHRLSPDAMALFERCIAFLGSDLEYEWPPTKSWSVSQFLLRFLGMRKRADAEAKKWTKEAERFGDLNAWPFIRKRDIEELSTRS